MQPSSCWPHAREAIMNGTASFSRESLSHRKSEGSCPLFCALHMSLLNLVPSTRVEGEQDLTTCGFLNLNFPDADSMDKRKLFFIGLPVSGSL